MGLVFQDYNLWPNRTIEANLTLAPRLVLDLPIQVAAERARHWLDRFGLDNRRTSYPGELSGGQQQRVAIARALMMEPDVLLLDEITSALDVEATSHLLDLMQSLRDGKRTFIYVTHHLGFAERATDRAAALVGGRIVEEGPPKKILHEPKSSELRGFLNAIRSVYVVH